MSNNQEEKFDPLPVEEDDVRSRFSVTRGDPDARARMWYNISNRTCSYMIGSNVNKTGSVPDYFTMILIMRGMALSCASLK